MANIFTRIRDAGRKKKSSSPPAPSVRQTGKVTVTSKEAASVPASQRRVVSTATGTKTQVARQLTTRATRRSGGGGGSVAPSPKVVAAVKLSSQKNIVKIDPRTGKAFGKLEVAKRETGKIKSLQQKLSERARRIQTSSSRGRSSRRGFKSEIKGQLRSIGLIGIYGLERTLGVVSSSLNLLKSLPKAPLAVINAVKNPKSTGMTFVSAAKSVPSIIKKSGESNGFLTVLLLFIRLIKESA